MIYFSSLNTSDAGLPHQLPRVKDKLEKWGDGLCFFSPVTKIIYEERRQGKTRSYHRVQSASRKVKAISTLFSVLTLPLLIIPALVGAVLLKCSKSHQTALAAYKKRALKLTVKIAPTPVKITAKTCSHMSQKEFDGLKTYLRKYWHTLTPKSKIYTSSDGYISLQPIGSRKVRVGLPPETSQLSNGGKKAHLRFFNICLDTYLPEVPPSTSIKQWLADRAVTQVMALHSLERKNFNKISKDLFQDTLKSSENEVQLVNSIKTNEPYSRKCTLTGVYFNSSLKTPSLVEYYDAKQKTKVEVDLDPNLSEIQIQHEIRNIQLKAFTASIAGHFPLVEGINGQHGFSVSLVPNKDPKKPPSKFILRIGENFEEEYYFDDPRLTATKNELTANIFDYVDKLKQSSVEALQELSEKTGIPFLGDESAKPSSTKLFFENDNYPIEVSIIEQPMNPEDPDLNPDLNPDAGSILSFTFRSNDKEAFIQELLKYKHYQLYAEQLLPMQTKAILTTENGITAKLSFINPHNKKTSYFEIDESLSERQILEGCKKQYNELEQLSATLEWLKDKNRYHTQKITIEASADCTQIVISYLETEKRTVPNSITHRLDELGEEKIVLKSGSLKREPALELLKIACRHLALKDKKDELLKNCFKIIPSSHSDQTSDNFPKKLGCKLPYPYVGVTALTSFDSFKTTESVAGMARFNTKDGSIDMFFYNYKKGSVDKISFSKDTHLTLLAQMMRQEQLNRLQELQAGCRNIKEKLHLQESSEAIQQNYLVKGAVEFEVKSKITGAACKAALLNLETHDFAIETYEQNLEKIEQGLLKAKEKVLSPLLKQLFEERPLSYTDTFHGELYLQKGQQQVLQHSHDFTTITFHYYLPKSKQWCKVETAIDVLPFHMNAVLKQRTEEQRLKFASEWKSFIGVTYPLLTRKEIDKINFSKLIKLFDKHFPNDPQLAQRKSDCCNMLQNIDNQDISKLDPEGQVRVWSMLAVVIEKLEELDPDCEEKFALIALAEKCGACSTGYSEGAYHAVLQVNRNSFQGDHNDLNLYFCDQKYRFIESYVQKYALGAPGDAQNVHSATLLRTELTRRGYTQNDFGKFSDWFGAQGCGFRPKPYADAIETAICPEELLTQIHSDLKERIFNGEKGISFYHNTIKHYLINLLRNSINTSGKKTASAKPSKYPSLEAKITSLIKQRNEGTLSPQACESQQRETYEDEIESLGWAYLSRDEYETRMNVEFFGREAVIAMLENEGYFVKS